MQQQQQQQHATLAPTTQYQPHQGGKGEGKAKGKPSRKNRALQVFLFDYGDWLCAACVFPNWPQRSSVRCKIPWAMSDNSWAREQAAGEERRLHQHKNRGCRSMSGGEFLRRQSAGGAPRSSPIAGGKRPVLPDYPRRGSAWTTCLLYTSPSPRDQRGSRMPSSA